MQTDRRSAKQVTLDGFEGQRSCVVVPADVAAVGDVRGKLTASEARALGVLRDFDYGTAHTNEWRDAIEKATGKALSSKTFNNWQRALIKNGYVEPVPGETHMYRVVVKDSGPSATAIEVPLARQSVATT